MGPSSCGNIRQVQCVVGETDGRRNVWANTLMYITPGFLSVQTWLQSFPVFTSDGE